MARMETWFEQDLKKPVMVRMLTGNLFSMDNEGNLIGVTVMDGGEPAELSGTVSANVIRSDGGTVAVEGNLSGNEATVVLPQAAYAVPGLVTIIIKLTNDGVITTLAAMTAIVYRTSTATAIDPGTIIPSIQTLITSIETAVASIPADYSSLWTSLAPAFSSSTAYVKGQYVTYNGKAYRFKADHAAGSWSADDVEETNIGKEITNASEMTNRAVKSIKNSTESEFDKILNTRPLVFVPGYYRVYRTNDNTTVDISAPETSNATSKTMVTAITPCSPGDVFTIRAYGGASTAAAYGFLDSNCKGIGRQGANSLIEDTFTVPEGAAYVIINNDLTNNPTNYYAFKGKVEYPFTLKGALTEENDLDDLYNTSDRGWYYWNSTHVPTNAPGSGAYKLLVLSNSSTSVSQLAVPVSGADHVQYRAKTSLGWSDWVSLAYTSDLSTAISEVNGKITGIKNDIYYPIADFEQGNIDSSGKNGTSQHPIRTGFIPIDDFVSVEVLGKSANNNNYTYQLFAYDAAYTYLGFGNTSRRTISTRNDVLTAYSTAKYVRIKVSGGDDGTNLDPSILDEYEYTGLIRISMEAVNSNSKYNDVTDIQSELEAKQDEDGNYTESFEIVIGLAADPKILSVVAQYTGDMPTVNINSFNPSSNVVNLASPYYELGGTREQTRKSWRIPAAHGVITKAKIIFTIPEETVVTIREASIHNDQRNRYADAGIIFHGHRGAIAPGDSVEAFQYGAELGYNSMITIPKFTADGTAICFHDDTSISGLLCWVDGTSITGTDDKAISEYTYAEITENFRMKSTLWGTIHVPTLEEYFRVCSLTGMNPILSIHSTPSGMYTGTTGTSHFNTIKALAKKWNVLNKLGIKSGDDSIMSCARGVFGTDARYIWISGQTHAPYNILTLSKNAGFVDNAATDLTGCPYDLCSEYFYKQTTESGTYYSDTVASMADMLSKGFKLSVADSDPYMTGPEMKRLIGAGVTEFTVDRHISMGLDW